MTPKQLMFAKEYLVDLNATQAAIRSGYSEKTANRIGPELLVKTCVRAEIDKAMQKRANRVDITADKVLENIERLASIAEESGDLSNALRGNELLGKHLKLFTDKVEHSGKLTLEDLIAGGK